MEERVENAKVHRGKNKILIQIGVVIILLFGIVTFIVSNMVVLASFSTALTAQLYTISGDILWGVVDSIEEYESWSWLMEYWEDHAYTMFPGGKCTVTKDDADMILRKTGREDFFHVNMEDVAAMSQEEQAIFAAVVYKELQEAFSIYSEDEKGSRMLLTLQGEDEHHGLVIFDGEVDEGVMPLGNIEDMDAVNLLLEHTQAAMRRPARTWALNPPSPETGFAMDVDMSNEVDGPPPIIYYFFSAKTVYESMLRTNAIRNSVICMLTIVAALILLYLYRIVSKPLEAVKESVSSYAETKDADAVTKSLAEIKSSNEIGVFADEFASLAQEMNRYIHEVARLAGEKERVETELNVAADIQSKMLEHTFPDREEFSLYASMTPAREVGGDFYDFYMIDDDHLALTIADVSGKGIPAALFMAVSMTALKNRTLMGGTPAEILKDVNDQLCERNEGGLFVTVWHGILNISLGELICANAGHEKPAFRMGDEPFRLIESKHGFVLGGMEGMKYRDEIYQLSAGDALFIYTDGVPEANNEENSLFGEERLISVLEYVHKDDTPEMILQKVRDAVEKFSGDEPQFDDLTMLCVILN